MTKRHFVPAACKLALERERTVLYGAADNIADGCGDMEGDVAVSCGILGIADYHRGNLQSAIYHHAKFPRSMESEVGKTLCVTGRRVTLTLT